MKQQVDYAINVMFESQDPYIIISNFFNDEEIKTINSLLVETTEFDGVGNYTQQAKIKQQYLSFDEENTYLSLIDLFEIANEHYNFNIKGIVENARLIEYTVGCFNDLHSDYYGDDLSKLSMSILLNDVTEFEGGELEFLNYPKVSLSKGDAIIFPSYIAHKVAVVTKGVRRVLVAHCAGDRFV